MKEDPRSKEGQVVTEGLRDNAAGQMTENAQFPMDVLVAEKVSLRLGESTLVA
jgi:hypothetical protein